MNDSPRPCTLYRLVIEGPLSAQVTRELHATLTGHPTGSPAADLPDRPDSDGLLRIDGPERVPGLVNDIAATAARILFTHRIDRPWTLTEDPCHGRLGTMYRHVPGVGVHRAACDTSGQALLTQTTFAALDSLTDAPDVLLGLITDHVGLPWRHAAPDAA